MAQFALLLAAAAIATLPLAQAADQDAVHNISGFRHGMVVGTTGAAAIEGGIEILKAGGSAADAAMATALTQVCMAAGSWVSYSGIMTMVYFDAKSGKTYDMNAAYNTVKAETDAAAMPGIDPADLAKDLLGGKYEPSGRTALVPGFIAGVDAAHKRFGKVSLKKVFEPAIRCAEQGIEWSGGLQGQYQFRQAVLSRLSETKRIFLKPDGTAYKLGDTFKQPVLAETLHHLANEGADYMYRGPWAKKFIAALARDGGRMTLEDLANYKVIWSEPLHTTYHGYDLFVHGRPADGGVNLVEAMNLADISGLSEMGKYSQSPQAMFTLAQIAKPQMLFEYLPDAPKTLGIDLSLESRVKKETSAKLWTAMQEGRVPLITAFHGRPAHSDAVVVIDRWGNIATVCHSINAISWGATGINVDGISINDSASFQREAIGVVTPGARLPDPTNPGLVVLKGKPFMGFSSIGSGLHVRTIGALVNVIDFGMTPQEAIDEPSLGAFLYGTQGEGGAPMTVGKGDTTPEFREQVGKLGQPMVENNALRGYWIGVQIDPKTGELHGGAIRELALGGRAVGY